MRKLTLFLDLCYKVGFKQFMFTLKREYLGLVMGTYKRWFKKWCTHKHESQLDVYKIYEMLNLIDHLVELAAVVLANGLGVSVQVQDHSGTLR